MAAAKRLTAKTVAAPGFDKLSLSGLLIQSNGKRN
jgi:hypothetical protein